MRSKLLHHYEDKHGWKTNKQKKKRKKKKQPSNIGRKKKKLIHVKQEPSVKIENP